MAAALSGTTIFLPSCGGSTTTETAPDESSIQSEQMYEHGDEPLQETGADTDTAGTDTTGTTTF